MRFRTFGVGRLRVFFYGRFHWKSLDHVFPSFTGVDVVSDDPPHPITHRWYQLAWFGLSANVDVPSAAPRPGFVLDVRGFLEAVGRMFS